MMELIEFLNYVDSGQYDHDIEYVDSNIIENPCGIWGFRDGIE
jgi:hypothetical protein